MFRHSQDLLPVSSTTAHLSRFLHETRLSDPAESSLRNKTASDPQMAASDETAADGYEELGSTPQLDLVVNEENKYHKMLRYLPNSDFHGDTSTPGPSVPNTFKHKSHPNARTKERIGRGGLLPGLPKHLIKEGIEVPDQLGFQDLSGLLACPGEPANEIQDNIELLDQIHHGDPQSINKIAPPKPSNVSHDISDNSTPSWMPPDLNQKWDYSNSVLQRPSRSNLPSLNPALDFLNGESNTFVHNPPSGSKVATPEWKRVSDQFNAKVPYDGSPLHGLFCDDSKHSEGQSHSQLKAASSTAQLVSTFSTPIASRDTDVHLTREQIHQLEDMLEKAKDQPDDYQIKGSPLKLFGSEYDTFTKAVLTKFVDKVRSNTASAQRESLPVSKMDPPKLKIKNFTQSTDFSNHDFLKNANNLFAQIQKNAYKSGNLISKPSTDSINFNSSLSNGLSNATSTPKISKKNLNINDPVSFDEYSSFLTDFDEESSAESLRQGHATAGDTRNEYTKDERTSLDESYVHPLESHTSDKSNDSSYTFDGISDLEDLVQYREHVGSFILSPKIRGSKKSTQPFSKISPFNENEGTGDSTSSSSSPPHNKEKQEYLPKESTISDFDHTFDSGKPGFIKWKTASQLKLARRNPNVNHPEIKLSREEHLNKGIVKPGSFPKQYGNMVFDMDHNKWISNDKENDYPGSLDSIEDLDTASAHNEESELKGSLEPSILKLSKRRSKRLDRNLEVSFQVPDDLNISVGSNHNITHLSDLSDVTFTQSNRMLVSLITGSMDESEWDKITSIDLSGKNLERVERLERYLPSIRRINLSNNHVKFISGLPSSLLELNASSNDILNITSFAKFHDLQVLNVSFNQLTGLSGISHNIHLTKLNLSNNGIESLTGLEKMSSLINLDLSLNKISGNIDFSMFSFFNLQELVLSENQILSVSGVESLKELRVLNLNDNQLESISCQGKHKHMKKLLLKFNRLKVLNLEVFPFLRVLRIDGNNFNEISGIKRLKVLQEMSLKCQSDQSLTEKIILSVDDAVHLDLSGNSIAALLWEKSQQLNVFANLNILNLSAVGLQDLSASFGDTFPNVRELNLNFNKLRNIEGLSKLQRLKRLNLLSNNVAKLEMVLSSLSGSRKALKVLDMRLNVLNFDFYPYVFNPHELEYALQPGFDKGSSSSPIPLEALDDIENFSIHYDALSKSQKEWEERDAEFFQNLRVEGKFKSLDERLNYETILIGFFPRLKELDGGSISSGKRAQMESRITIRSPR